MFSQRIKDGLIAGGAHLVVSLLVATSVFLLLQKTWFVPPWADLMDGDALLAMIIGIDVVCGPLLTGLVVHSAKVRWKNVLDIVVIASVQLAALGYGMWTAWQAKPSWLVFETDRFVLVRQADLQLAEGGRPRVSASPRFVGLEIKAVQNLAPEDPAYLPSLGLSLQGIPPAYRPERWGDYAEAVSAVAQIALFRPHWQAALQSAEKQAYPLQPGIGLPDLQHIRFVPLQIGWRSNWVVLVDSTSFHPLAVMQADAWASTSNTP